MGLTERAWRTLAEHLDLARRLREDGSCEVTADEIKCVTGREPRLMAKFDTRASRPTALSRATLLPIANGKYVVLDGDGYHDVEATAEVIPWQISSQVARLATLPWNGVPASESQAIDMALISGALGDFLGDDNLFLTVRGRRRTPAFDMQFQGRSGAHTLRVNGVQVECDAGLEGQHLHLIEAKLGHRDDFLVRQIYYPYRMWGALLPEKERSAVFLTWSNRTFAFRRYRFDPEGSYHGLRLVKAADYVLDQRGERPSLREAVDTATLEALPRGVPFPQADDMRRVVDVVEAVAAGCTSKQALSDRWGFAGRQGDYYANAAAFMGLLARRGSVFRLSENGKLFARWQTTERQRYFVGRMAVLPVFCEVIRRAVEHGRLPDRQAVADLVAEATSLTGTTPPRRAITVLSWVRWAVEACSDEIELA